MTMSERAETMRQKAQVAATEEVRKHLEAGRTVYGRRDGKPVAIVPKRIEND